MTRKQHNLTVDPVNEPGVSHRYRCTLCGRTWDTVELEMIDGECTPRPAAKSFGVNVIGMVGPDGVLRPIANVPIEAYLSRMFPKEPEGKGLDLFADWASKDGAEIWTEWTEEGSDDDPAS